MAPTQTCATIQISGTDGLYDGLYNMAGSGQPPTHPNGLERFLLDGVSSTSEEEKLSKTFSFTDSLISEQKRWQKIVVQKWVSLNQNMFLNKTLFLDEFEETQKLSDRF